MVKVWLNGKIVDEADANIFVMNRGFMLADGIFETMYFTDNEVEYYQYHMLRLRNACNEMSIPCHFDESSMLKEIRLLMAENSLYSGAVRITVSRGVGGRGLTITDGMVATVVMTVASVQRLCPPARMCVSTFTRNDTSPLSHLKTLSYTENILALDEVSRHSDVCNEALILNTKGNVCCASIGNVFLILGDSIVTPNLDQGCLAGIMRSIVIQSAKKMGLSVYEQVVSLGDIKNADAVFITNSIVKIREVVTFDDICYKMGNDIIRNLVRII